MHPSDGRFGRCGLDTHSGAFLVKACVPIPDGYIAFEQSAVVLTALQVDFSSASGVRWRFAVFTP